MLKLFKTRESKITFIFGCPRGGTTWLWSLLETHPNVVPFTNFIEKDSEGYYSTSESGIYLKEPKRAKKIIQSFCKTNSSYNVIEKTPLHTLKYRAIKKDFPKSKDIVILRNPLAIVNSMYSSNMLAFKNYDIHRSVLEVKKYFTALSDIINTNLPFITTYESLLIDTKYEFIKVLNYLELSDEKLDSLISENMNRTKVKVSGAYRKGQIDSFVDDLSESQILTIKKELEEEILLFERYL